MGKKVNRVPVYLDSGEIKELSDKDIHIILRAADPLIMSSGRNMLAKLLKGSREKKLLDLELDQCPVYGAFKSSPLDLVKAKIDWMIQNRYLKIEYDWRLPLLVFTDAGWAIEKEARANEFVATFDQMLTADPGPYDMGFLKERERAMILRVLDLVEASADVKYIPLLEAWVKVDCKKVQKRIRGVISVLRKE